MRYRSVTKLATRFAVSATAIVLCSGAVNAVAQADRHTPPAITETDPQAVPPMWGAEHEGVRVALTVDKQTFKLGEDIVAHIAAEVVSAAQPVYGEPSQPRPSFGATMEPSFNLAIMDEDGPLVPDRSADFYNSVRTVGGPTMNPAPLPVGKIIPLDRSLKTRGLLPTRPGKYKLTATWSPYRANDSLSTAVPPGTIQPEKPLVRVVSKAVFVQIVGIPPKTDIPEFPEYTAWKSAFDLGDTVFGEKTALFDRTTGLEWLRPSLTAGLSEKEVGRSMEAGAEFKGWRFATNSEVITFLAHFTGSPDGHTTNPAIVRKLIRLLGGDAERGIRNNEGWSRIAIYVRIAELTAATFEQTHNPACPTCGVSETYIGEDRQNGRVSAIVEMNSGWTDADGPGYGGIFLVRKR